MTKRSVGPVLALIFASALVACASPRAPARATQLLAMTPAEETYVAQTGSVIYARASLERLDGLLFSDERGHGTCVRSPAGAGDAADYTLLVLQRRVDEEFISQVEDDIAIRRSMMDAAPCRALAERPSAWLRVR